MEKITPIFKPFLELESRQKNADKKKFEEILAILPPTIITGWCDEDLWNAQYRKSWTEFLDTYPAFMRESSINFFSRDKLSKKYKLLNQSFLALTEYMGSRFFVNDFNRDFMQLTPHLKDEPERYAAELEGLHKHVGDFKNKYDDFVKTGREEYIGTISFLVSATLYILFIFGVFKIFS